MFFVFPDAVDVFFEQISSGTCREGTAVDGRNPANQLRLVVYLMIYRVLYIPHSAGFLPSTVSLQFNIFFLEICQH